MRLRENLKLCLDVVGVPNVFLCFPAPASVFALPFLFCEHSLLDYPVNLSMFLVHFLIHLSHDDGHSESPFSKGAVQSLVISFHESF